MMKSALPNRWTNYLNMGSRIAGTCFVPLKVPLKEDFFRTRPPHLMFTPSMVIDAVTNLATVIDLTNTNRYYHPKEFTDRRVAHKKIFCLGHEIPSDKVVHHFFSIVDDHLKCNSAQGTDSVIGVHCTHGINRTGYLICLYMIKRLGFTPNDALKAFGEARGHPVERTNYIDDLRRLSGDRAGEFGAGGSIVRYNLPRENQWISEAAIRRPLRRQELTEPASTSSQQQLPQHHHHHHHRLTTRWRQMAESMLPRPPPPPPPPSSSSSSSSPQIWTSRPHLFQPTPYQIPDRHQRGLRRQQPPGGAPPEDHPRQWRHRLPGQHPQAVDVAPPRRPFSRRSYKVKQQQQQNH